MWETTKNRLPPYPIRDTQTHTCTNTHTQILIHGPFPKLPHRAPSLCCSFRPCICVAKTAQHWGDLGWRDSPSSLGSVHSPRGRKCSPINLNIHGIFGTVPRNIDGFEIFPEPLTPCFSSWHYNFHNSPTGMIIAHGGCEFLGTAVQTTSVCLSAC